MTVASVQDRDGARLLLRHLPGGCKKLKRIWVDGGYGDHLVDWVEEWFKFCLEVVLHPRETRKFVLLPRRWVVERTFALAEPATDQWISIQYKPRHNPFDTRAID